RRFFQSLGQLRYLSLLRFVKGVVGNSSSGIIEAPEFGVGTVNIGSRQDGRVKPRSVVDCACKRSDIEMAIRKIISPEFSTVLDALDHPYGKGKTTEAIMDVLKSTQFSKLNRKKFFDIKKH
ncbi:MAG TPA: UDP-N-acetylglucosamine 2-epimerase, partial [bacterium]|nr:UDP-N-acetylglucosamine 2-epimerase [bacterium]